FNGNLFDGESKKVQPLGQDFAAYTANIAKEYIDLSITALQISPDAVLTTATPTVTVVANLANNGGIDAQQVTAQLWLKDAQGVRTLVAQNTPLTTLGAGCSTLPITLQWQPTGFTPGPYTLSLEVQASN